ncbi:ABC transporter ATP-binding protein [Deltaproteobacteria bacterium TL4]
MSTILNIRHLSKSFVHASSKKPIEVLNNLELQVEQGETVAILGQSGSGKSTLLSLLAALDRPDSGHIEIQGQDLAQMNEETLTRFRAKNIGIIFQQFYLMSHLTALENVSLPLEMARQIRINYRATETLGQVGLIHRTEHFPHQLSGGECQRVAIARALVIHPAILLADEPTGNLDHETGEYVLSLLLELVELRGMTMILVTHNEALAKRCSRQLVLKGGGLH